MLTEQTNMVFRQRLFKQARLAVPPDPGGHRGQDQFDVHAAGADGRAVPLVGQQPGVGDIAIQAGREHEDHHAHFVAFAAEVLARQAVAELVQDLGHAQRDGEQQRVLEAEELVERRQPRREDVELHRHQGQRGKAQQDAGRHRRAGVEPAHAGIEPVEESFGVETLEADAEDIGQGAQEFLPAAFAAALEQLLALAAHGGDHQPAAVQHAEELLEFFQGDLLRGKLLFEAVLQLVEADRRRPASSAGRIPLPGSGSSSAPPGP